MMTRKQYIENNRNTNCGFDLHQDYYSQFVTEGIKSRVKRAVKIAKLARDYAEGDTHLNRSYSCAAVWDRLMPVTPYEVMIRLKEAGEDNTLSTKVCILKAAARMLIDELKSAQ